MQTTRKTTEYLNTQSSAKEKNKPVGDVRLYGVMSDQLDVELVPGQRIWDLVEPHIIQALKRGADNKYSSSDIRRFIQSRDMQLWLLFDNTKDLYGCAVTQIINYPNEKRLLFLIVAGKDLDYWYGNHELINKWAKEQGCKATEFYGRKGWEKIHKAKNSGYEMIHIVMRREL